MKATFNFTVHLDGYDSAVVMDIKKLEGMPVSMVALLMGTFKEIEDKISATLEKHRVKLQKANVRPDDKGSTGDGEEIKSV